MKYHRCTYCETNLPATAMKRIYGQMKCRSEIQCFNRLLFRYRTIKRIGAQMANVMFNLSQPSTPVEHREIFELLRLQWDTAMKGETK